MYVLNADITIAGMRFTRVHQVQVESSAKVLEDMATITLPATARLERQGEFISDVETAKAFTVGDTVVIKLGYDDNLREEFRGFVSRIKPGTPLEVECIDATWSLRRRNLRASFREISLKSLLEYILLGADIVLKGDVPGITLRPYYLKNVTAATALQKIKDEYGLTMYLKNFNELHVGLTSYTDNVMVVYGLGENVIDNDLEWREEDDTRLRIKAVHIKKDNTKVEKTVGDADGELRTLYFYNLPSGTDLATVAEQEIKKYKYAGFEGGLTTFLLPNVAVGNVARLRDKQFAECSGDYLVDKVVTTFGTNGARRKVTLGLKV